jgi:hypothetical protein
MSHQRKNTHPQGELRHPNKRVPNTEGARAYLPSEAPQHAIDVALAQAALRKVKP